MKIKRGFPKDFFVGIISILVVVVGFLLQSHSVIIGLVISYVLLVSFLYSSKSILDPRSLLLVMIAVYSMWFPLQVLLIGDGYDGLLFLDGDILLSSIKLQMFGIVVFVMNCLILIDEDKVAESRSFFFESLALPRKEYFSEKFIFWPVLIFVLLALLVTAGSGGTTKREILDSGSTLKYIAELFFYILIVIVVLSYLRSGSGFLTKKAFAVILLALSYFLLLGERDVFFRVAVLVFLVLIDRRNMWVFGCVLFIVLVAMILVPVAQGFKAVLLSGEINLTRQGLDLIFSNEFVSAGRNLYSLMYYGVENSFSFLFNDVLRSFVPSVLLPGIDVQSTGSWFNSVYRVEKGFSGTSGWGFSFMAQGYLMAGHLGVFLIMTIAACILSLLYRRSYNSEYWYVFYLLALTTYVYVMRADLANLLSQVFKIGGLAVLGVYFAHFFFVKLRRKQFS